MTNQSGKNAFLQSDVLLREKRVFEMAMISKEAQQQVLYLLRNVGKKIREMQDDSTWRNVSSFEGFKTSGDQQAHSILVSGLGDITPKIPVFSEETPHSIDDRPEQYWLIDPIDGTSSWHGGFEGYDAACPCFK